MVERSEDNPRWPAARVAGELLVVALGVLLALAADATWDSRSDRVMERQYLEALRVEMIGAAGELQEDDSLRLITRAVMDSLETQFAVRPAPGPSVARWVGHMDRELRRFFPPSAVLDELTASGNLSLLRSNELRFALMEYQRERTRLNFVEDHSITAAEAGIRPYVRERYPLTLQYFEASVAESAPDAELSTLLADPVFRNLMGAEIERLERVLRISIRLGDLIDRTTGLLERGLGLQPAS